MKKTKILKNSVPSCTDSKTFFEWIDAARKTGKPSCGFCTDCTPEFAEKNRLKGTCDYPNVVFKKTSSGEIYGVFGPYIKTEVAA